MKGRHGVLRDTKEGHLTQEGVGTLESSQRKRHVNYSLKVELGSARQRGKQG